MREGELFSLLNQEKFKEIFLEEKYKSKRFERVNGSLKSLTRVNFDKDVIVIEEYWLDINNLPLEMKNYKVIEMKEDIDEIRKYLG